jgi:hypothetical protein
MRIKVTTNWCDDRQIREAFNRCTKKGDYRWNDLYLIPDEEKDYEYIVVVNYPRYTIDTKKAIILDAEAYPSRRRWAHLYCDKTQFFKHFSTEEYYTIDKWYIERNYEELLKSPAKTKMMSGIISSNYILSGHIDRLNFCLRYLDKLSFYDHYSRNSLSMRTYRGSLKDKADGLLDYKYTFNAENYRENNYITEKLLDGILCETLTFYDGAPNADELLDPRCFIKVDLKKPAEAFEIVTTSIENDEWEKRIGVIREEKKRLMNDRNVLNIIDKIIKRKI